MTRRGSFPRGTPGSPRWSGPAVPESHALPLHTHRVRAVHDPARPGPLRRVRVDGVPGRDARRGDPAPEHADLLQAPGYRGPVRRRCRVADGVLLAERAEGIASVAHALAFCHAVEAIAGCRVPREAALIRVVHAELERIANHLDVAVRLADAAGLAVATARFALHKERVMRLISALCGSRFGRGVVVPGGVAAVSPGTARGDPGAARPAGKAGHRGRQSADGHLLVPGPAARHRPADPGPRPGARRARPYREGFRLYRRRPPGPSLRRLPGCSPSSLSGSIRRETRCPGSGCAGTRSPRLSAWSGRLIDQLAERGGVRPASPASRPRAGRPAGPRPRRARCSTT